MSASETNGSEKEVWKRTPRMAVLALLLTRLPAMEQLRETSSSQYLPREVWTNLLTFFPDPSLTKPTSVFWQVKFLRNWSSYKIRCLSKLDGRFIWNIRCHSVLGLDGKWNKHWKALQYRHRTVANSWRWTTGRKEERILCYTQVLHHIRPKYSGKKKDKKERKNRNR